MIVADTANLHTFVDAFRFIGDHPAFLLTKTLEQIELSGAALGLALLAALPLGVVLGHFQRGSGIAIGASIVGRGLPEPRPDCRISDDFGNRIREQHGRARRARERPDPHERLRRGRPGSTATRSRPHEAWA